MACFGTVRTQKAADALEKGEGVVAVYLDITEEDSIGLAAQTIADEVGDEEQSDPSDPDSERYATGAALPGPDAKLAGPTFEEWLDATVPAGRA
jgi:hypothetical protein